MQKECLVQERGLQATRTLLFKEQAVTRQHQISTVRLKKGDFWLVSVDNSTSHCSLAIRQSPVFHGTGVSPYRGKTYKHPVPSLQAVYFLCSVEEPLWNDLPFIIKTITCPSSVPRPDNRATSSPNRMPSLATESHLYKRGGFRQKEKRWIHAVVPKHRQDFRQVHFKDIQVTF